jgi:succinyl-diaminopimelate desuccinylase
VLGRVGALVVGEPTGLVPRLGHRGVVWIRLHFRGRTAHASMPEEGDNAVLKAAGAALALSARDWSGIAHPVLGSPSLNVGRLEGGLNLNSVPDRAVLGIDVRTVPGQSSEGLLAELARLYPEAEAELLADCPPLWSDPGAAWLEQVAERAAALTGGRAALAPVPFATDAGYLTPAYGEPPTVILGPGATEQAHKTDEWCSATLIEQATELYDELATAWCQTGMPPRLSRA